MAASRSGELCLLAFMDRQTGDRRGADSWMIFHERTGLRHLRFAPAPGGKSGVKG
jgi:hypothetical protein